MTNESISSYIIFVKYYYIAYNSFIFCSSFAMHAIIETTKWPIELDLYPDEAPNTVANFVNLAMKEYYNDLLFHRVIEDFMIQGGCPEGTGAGGPWYNFADEFHPERRHDAPGVLSMANSGPSTNGSQFFITHIETSRLDDKHTVFGKVRTEQDQAIVSKVQQGDKIINIQIHGETAELFEKAKEFLETVNTALWSQWV